MEAGSSEALVWNFRGRRATTKPLKPYYARVGSTYPTRASDSKLIAELWRVRVFERSFVLLI
jgi:hypothetical protein